MPVACRRDQRHAMVVGVLGGGEHDLPDRGLLGQLLGRDRTRHVVAGGCAVVQPRVGVEALTVRHTSRPPCVGGIGEGSRRFGPQEEVARVLAGADVHDRRVRSDAGDADAVAGERRCRPRACRDRPRPRWRDRQSGGVCGYSAVDVGLTTVKLMLRSLLKFGAMSGWLPSTPVSMMPTVTPLPVARRCAASAVAPIMLMSH